MKRTTSAFIAGIVLGGLLATLLATRPSAQMTCGATKSGLCEEPNASSAHESYWTHDCTEGSVGVLTAAMNGTKGASNATAFYNPLARATCVIYRVSSRTGDGR